MRPYNALEERLGLDLELGARADPDKMLEVGHTGDGWEEGRGGWGVRVMCSNQSKPADSPPEDKLAVAVWLGRAHERGHRGAEVDLVSNPVDGRGGGVMG